ncbi:hypothetical protein Ndes2526B_g03401 [Nannochloris sp. 'desiccata']
MRNMKIRGGGEKSSFWAEGKNDPQGLLFSESPLPAGQKRKWESWEAPWYFTFGAATAILALGLPARPDSSLVRWADRQAAERAESV